MDAFTRTESASSWTSERTCTLSDGTGKKTPVEGANCLSPVPWFAPGLVGPGRLSNFVTLTDDGEVSLGGSPLHRLCFVPPVAPAGEDAKLLLAERTVHVYYDPVTLRPTAMEYSLHPDDNDGVSIPVTVVYSDHRTIGVFSVPFHLERFVNGVKQLTIQADTISAK